MLGGNVLNGQGAVDTLLEDLGLVADLGAVEAPFGVHGLVGSDDWKFDLVAGLSGDSVWEFLIERGRLLVVLLGSGELLDHATDVRDAPFE